MSENIRALIIILVLATAFVVFARTTACAITTSEDFARRRNIWFALTITAFLAPNFWLFLVIAVLILVHAIRREPNPPSLYFFILFVLPVATVQVSGMGLVNMLFDLTYARVLSLLILLPAFLSLRRHSDNPSFGSTGADKALAAYLSLLSLLYLRDDSLTNTLRQIFYLFIDIFLPYYFISRSLKTLQSFRDALLSLVLGIMILAPLAVFESIKGWLLYSSVNKSLELGGGMTNYLGRDGLLRALVTTGQPIALGFLMVVGIGIYIFLQHSITRKFHRRIGMSLLVAGLIAPLSRGPWIGSVVLLAVFIATGRFAFRRLMSVALAAALLLPLISVLPGGERIINLLPFIGTTEKANVEYRERLITNSMIVINRNPWFGSTNYLETPEMEEMRQGQGIVDIVNSYISITLETGWVGLGLFVSVFVLTLLGIFKSMRSIPDKDSEEYLLGRVLLAIQLSIMVMIFTVSSITIIPIVYWSIAGVAVAYAQMIRRQRNTG